MSGFSTAMGDLSSDSSGGVGPVESLTEGWLTTERWSPREAFTAAIQETFGRFNGPPPADRKEASRNR